MYIRSSLHVALRNITKQITPADTTRKDVRCLNCTAERIFKKTRTNDTVWHRYCEIENVTAVNVKINET